VDSTQAPLPIKTVSRALRSARIQRGGRGARLGGGFGTKIMLFYPEEILVPHAAIMLGRP